MGAMLKLKDYVPDVTSAPIGDRISAIEALGRDVRGEGAIHSLEREIAALRRGTARLITESRHKRPANIDALIDNLLAEERKADQDSRSQIKAAKRGLRALKSVPQGYRRAVEPLMRRMIDLLEEQKEILRDTRWQLMVIRADDVAEGVGPVFDDPKALRRYLTKSRR